jgi:hypothetical protein
MPYVADARPLLRHAFDHHYAIPSFNVCSLEAARAIVEAAEALRAPVMLQTYPGDLEHASPAVMAALVRALGEEASVPVLLHLDHGDSLERAAACIRAGYGSVMYDGEALPLADNVAAVSRLACFAHAAGVAVEAAAGSFGGGEGHDESRCRRPARGGEGQHRHRVVPRAAHDLARARPGGGRPLRRLRCGSRRRHGRRPREDDARGCGGPGRLTLEGHAEGAPRRGAHAATARWRAHAATARRRAHAATAWWRASAATAPRRGAHATVSRAARARTQPRAPRRPTALAASGWAATPRRGLVPRPRACCSPRGDRGGRASSPSVSA